MGRFCLSPQAAEDAAQRGVQSLITFTPAPLITFPPAPPTFVKKGLSAQQVEEYSALCKEFKSIWNASGTEEARRVPDALELFAGADAARKQKRCVRS